MRNVAKKIYRGIDPRELPAYEIKEAAKYLRVPYFVLYGWLSPVKFATNNGFSVKPIICRPDGGTKLSFLNIVEAHVVKALRREHYVPAPDIRAAIDYAERELNIPRLLIDPELKAGARQIFIKKMDQLINLGRGGQLAMEEMLNRYLERIDYEQSLPTRLFPFLSTGNERIISISPRTAFGKPIVASAGVTTHAIAQRFELGEEKADLAKDYGITEAEVEEAIIYEAAA